MNSSAPAVDLAARILKLLTRYRMLEATLTMISTELGASKATCLRVLRTLESHGLLRFNPVTKRYSLGPYAVVLGARSEESTDYLSAIRPLLRAAADRTGCTAVFVQRIDDNRMIYLAKQEATSRLRVNISVGNRFPITEVSYGKWLLAYASTDVRDALLANGLRQVTPHTVVDRDRYLAQLDEIRTAGVMVSREEYVLGVTAVSCPVFDVHDQFLGVLAVLALMSTADPSTLDRVVDMMREISHECYLSGLPQAPAQADAAFESGSPAHQQR